MEFDELAAERRATQLANEEYGAIKTYCFHLFRKKGFVRMQNETTWTGVGAVDVFVRDADAECRYVANRVYTRFPKISPKCESSKHGCKLVIDLFPFFIFWTVPANIFTAFFKKSREVVPGHAFLICLYRELYNPVNLKNYNKLVQQITGLQTNLGVTSDIVEGAGEKNIKLVDLKPLLKNAIHIGKVAYKAFGISVIDTDTPEVISDNVLELVQAIKAKYPVSVETIDVPILTDFSITRTTITLRRELLHIYNSAEYELIPYFVTSGQKIGTVFVTARFLLINIWFGKFLGRGNKDLIKKYKIMHDELLALLPEMDTRRIVPDLKTGDYCGTNVAENFMWKQDVKWEEYKPRVAEKKRGRLIYL